MAEPLDPKELLPDARWLAQAYDPGLDLVRFVAMDQEAYRAAPFLDDRMFEQWRDVRTLSLPLVVQATEQVRHQDANWIFHVGHVGSTLIARMLGELEGILSIREPRILRDVAFLPADRRRELIPAVRTLCSRSFAPLQRALVKATSFVSEIAPELVAPGARAVFMHANARSYIETILAGENSVKELHALHGFRTQRMAGRMPDLAGATQTDAHRAAMAWACEMSALGAAAETMDDRDILWLDFDLFLASPAASLRQVAGHLGTEIDLGVAERIATGPLLSRYSKSLEFDYSPDLRLELQLDARRRHGAEIESALSMLSEASGASPYLARAIGRAAGRE